MKKYATMYKVPPEIKKDERAMHILLTQNVQKTIQENLKRGFGCRVKAIRIGYDMDDIVNDLFTVMIDFTYIKIPRIAKRFYESSTRKPKATAP